MINTQYKVAEGSCLTMMKYQVVESQTENRIQIFHVICSSPQEVDKLYDRMKSSIPADQNTRSYDNNKLIIRFNGLRIVSFATMDMPIYNPDIYVIRPAYTSDETFDMIAEVVSDPDKYLGIVE